MRGEKLLEVEVTHISKHGLWILVNNREYFLPYKEFPWFKKVPIEAILNVEQLTKGHLYWPDLDVDLSLDIIEHQERFILKARIPSSEAKNAKKNKAK